MRPLQYNDNKEKYIRYLIYAAVIAAAALLQNSSVAFPEIFGARAFLLVPLSIAISMHEREIPASLFGAFAGLLWDVSSGNDGFNTFVLMALSATSSILISHLMRRNIITAFVLGGGALVIYELLYVLINLTLSGAGSSLKLLLTFYLPSTVYTLLFVPVMYYITSSISKRS